MSETLYRKQIREVTSITPNRPASSFVSYTPAGEFRRVQWCRTHDADMPGDRCWKFVFPDDPVCELVEVWQEVTP